MKVVLLSLALGLGALLYVQWEIAPEQAPPPLPQRGADASDGGEIPAQDTAADFALGDPRGFDVISQRPLFSEERRPKSWGPRYRGIDEDVANHSLVEVCALQWRACVRSATKAMTGLDESVGCAVRYSSNRFSTRLCRRIFSFLFPFFQTV